MQGIKWPDHGPQPQPQPQPQSQPQLLKPETQTHQLKPKPPFYFTKALWDVVAAWAPRAPNRCLNSSCEIPLAPSAPPLWSSTAGNNHEPRFLHLGNGFNQSFAPGCPDYFRFIHHDLAPWKASKISKQLLDTARTHIQNEASFTVVIKAGRLYVDPIGNCFQTRAVFSIWGLFQLIKLYPGLVPDVELVFGCGDKPVISRVNYTRSLPPPVFRYCTTTDDFDIPFPDWSFWGWPEVNLQPWDTELHSIRKGASEMNWRRRSPKAFWKGNPHMGDGTRKKLLKCGRDFTDIQDQDWSKETGAGFQHSKLSEQCKHRYKVYVEGMGWSVSLKYILACDSPVLLVQPKYLEFFTRGLIAEEHFWSVPTSNLCPAIKSSVKRGNKHMIQAEKVGKQGSRFVTEQVTMARVYDYMLHLLREYASLLDFSPEPAMHLRELCPDTFLCVAPPAELPFYKNSTVHEPSRTPPCFFESSTFTPSSFTLRL